MNKRTADFEEARWRRLADADAVQEPLLPADREFLEGYQPQSPAARAEQELFAALAGLGDGDLKDEEAANSPLISATVQHVLGGAPAWGQPAVAAALEPQVEPPRRRGWAIAAGGLVAAAAVVAAWFGLQAFGGLAPERDPSGGSVARAEPSASSTLEARDTIAAAPQQAPEGLRFSVSSGEFVTDHSDEPLVASATLKGPLRVRSERACLGVEGTSACFEHGALVSIGAEDPLHLEVLEGEARIEAQPLTVGEVVVQVAGDRYTLSSPVIIQTTVFSRKDARVEITKGSVELVGSEGDAEVLRAVAVRGRTRSRTSGGGAPDTKTLLARARASRAAGDRKAAIASYEKLLKLYPKAPASKAAMVSLGDLYLDVRRPRSALRWFQRYLSRGGGPLAQEAHVGRIKALGAMGKDEQRRKAVEAFRRRYPGSRYMAELGAAR